MFTPSTFLSIVLIAASMPAFCAPVPFTPVAPRGIASALEGLVGGGVEDLIKAFLHPGNSENSRRSVGSVVEGAASHLIEPIVSGVGSAIGDEIHGILGKVFSRRAFKDLSDDEINTLFEYINSVNKREVDARFSIKDAIKDAIKDVAGSSLTSAALEGVEKLFGALAERSLNELD